MSDNRRRPIIPAARPCAFCGQTFRPSWPKAAYCTKVCRAKAQEARRVGRKRPTPPKEEG